MNISRYNSLVDIEDGTLLFNAVSGAIMKLGEKSLRYYKAVASGEDAPESFMSKLAHLGFLVESQDERSVLENKYNYLVNDSKFKHLFVVVTDQCNLGCGYCYEEKKQWIKMSDATQDQVIEFVEKFLDSSPTQAFGVGWFGGEPTLHMKAVSRLSRTFRQLCDDRGISQYMQQMTTNGTTFSDHIADQMIELGIRNCQITLDGIQEDHDQKRPFLKHLTNEQITPVLAAQRSKIGLSLNILGQEPKIKVKSSFQAIMNSLEKLISRGVSVSLRMNVDQETIERTPILLESLFQKGYFSKNEAGGSLYAYAAPIFDGCSGNTGNAAMSQEEFAQKVSLLREWYKSRKIDYLEHYTQLKFTGSTCTANKRNEFVINPDGSLTKCTHHIGDASHSIGHVANFALKNAGNIHLFNPFKDPECRECPVLPLCMGGCKSLNKKPGEYGPGCLTARYNLPDEVRTKYQEKISK